MDSGPALTGMQAEAHACVGVVGDLGALVHFDRSVGFARGDDEDAAGAQQGPQPDAEREVGSFFKLAAIEVSAGIVSTVSRVQHHDKALSRGRRRRLLCGNCGRGRDQDRGRGLT